MQFESSSVSVVRQIRAVNVWGVGRVHEIFEVYVASTGACLLRMMLSETRGVAFEDETRGQVLSVERSEATFDQVFPVESTGVLEVVCDESDAKTLVYTYIY